MGSGEKRVSLRSSTGLEVMELHLSLRDNVRLLGEQLGQIMVTDRSD